MAMSRKDYVNLATAMGMELRYRKNVVDDRALAGAKGMLAAVTDALNSANANFDRDRFVSFTLEVASGARDAEGRKVKGAA